MRSFLILIVVIWFIMPVYTQLHCINYTSQDGLNSDHVICAVEDKNGFMWFGTSKGLCRFDGLNFTNFSNSGKGNPPEKVFVRDIEIDEFNNVWIGTENQGIYCYNQSNATWISYHSNSEEGHRLKSNEIHFLKSDKAGKMWYGASNSGLAYIDFEKDSLVNYYLEHIPMRGGWPNSVYDLIEDPRDSLKYLIVAQGYLLSFDTENEKITIEEELNEVHIPVSSQLSFHSLVAVSESKLMLGTWGLGIYEYDLLTRELIRNNPKEFEEGIIWRSNVSTSQSGMIWAAYRQKGISSYNPTSKDWNVYRSEAFNRNGLPKGDIEKIYPAKDGKIWVLSMEGISLIVPEFQAFDYFENEENETNYFHDVYYDEKSNKYYLVFSGDSGPLKIFDEDFTLETVLTFPREGTDFRSLFKIISYQDDLYFLSNELYFLNRKTELLEKFNFGDKITVDSISDMVIDDQGVFWILCRNYTLVQYDPQSRTSKVHEFSSHKLKGLSFFQYNGMTEVGDDLWISAQSELVIFSKENFRSHHFYFNGTSFVNNKNFDIKMEKRSTVNQVVEVDETCALVLIKGQGLFETCYDLSSDSISISNSLNSKYNRELRNAIRIVKGYNDVFWIASTNGLMYSDSEFKEIRIFDQRTGLRQSKLNYGLVFLKDELFVGTGNGFVKISCENLVVKEQPNQCIFTELVLGDYDLNSEEDNIYPFDVNSFSATVSLPNFYDAKQVTYAHRLIGSNDEWIYSGSDARSFNYPKLVPGEYTMEVKARSPSFEWSDVSRVSFIIKAPFWATGLFRFFSILITGLLIYGLYKIKVHRVLKMEKMKTKMARLESQVLRSQMNPHFIFNSLNSIKSLILMGQKESSISYLTQFSSLVRNILANSQESMIPLEKELKLLELYLEMESLRFKEKFNYKIDIGSRVNIYKLRVPPLIIQPYVENAIWHGLLHKEGCAKLIIKLKIIEDQLMIEVLDNGIGRNASEQMRSKNSNYQKKYFGSEMSRNRVEILEGESSVDIIDIEKKGVPKGTKVVIKLPIKYG